MQNETQHRYTLEAGNISYTVNWARFTRKEKQRKDEGKGECRCRGKNKKGKLGDGDGERWEVCVRCVGGMEEGVGGGVQVLVQEGGRGMEIETKRDKRHIIRVRIPALYELISGDMPRSLSDSISQSTGLLHKNKQLRIQPIPLNSYQKQTNLNYLLHYRHPLSLSSSPMLIPIFSSTPQPQLHPLSYFTNHSLYTPYFIQPIQYLQGLCTNRKGEGELGECRFVVYGLYHVEQREQGEENKGGVIDGLWMWVYRWGDGEWVKEEEVVLQPIGGGLARWSSLQRWQSTIQLQYKLKTLLHKLTHSYYITYHPHPHPPSRCHYLLTFTLNQGHSQTYTILVYNHETLLQDAIRGEIDAVGFAGLYGVVSGLGRRKYPVGYYSGVLEMYYVVCGYVCTQNVPDNIIQICKYNIIQNINPHNNPHIQPLTIPYRQLSINPITPTLIFYWLVLPPGSNKAHIIQNIMAILEDFPVEMGKIGWGQGEELEGRLRGFLGREGMFGKERFGVGVVQGWFSLGRLEELVGLLGRVVPQDVYYQLCLVTTQADQATPFISPINNRRSSSSSSSSQPQPIHRPSSISPPSSSSTSSITTTYTFPLNLLLSSLLTIQSRPYSPLTPHKLHSQGTASLATALHYISSTYTNLDLRRVVAGLDVRGGEVRVIQFGGKDRGRGMGKGMGWRVCWEGVQREAREEVEDQLRILLEASFKKVTEEDVLLAYFLENIEELEYQVELDGIAQDIIDGTFPRIPYSQPK